MKKIASVVLAAGLGTRMKSNFAKVLHEICGKPLIHYVVSSLRKAGLDSNIIVVGYQKEEVIKCLAGIDLEFVVQDEQLGTGHAVMKAKEAIYNRFHDVLVTCGDIPLLKTETVRRFVDAYRNSGASCIILTTLLDDPYGYGRIIRNNTGNVVKIVEEKDASREEKQVREINTGIFIFDTDKLVSSLSELKNENIQKEYYLTDVVEIFLNKGFKISALIQEDFTEVMGINSRAQMAEAEKILWKRKACELMLNGTTLKSPENIFISPDVEIGQESVIYPGVVIEGNSQIGRNVYIGQYSYLKDVIIEDSVHIEGCAFISGKHIKKGTLIEFNKKVT